MALPIYLLHPIDWWVKVAQIVQGFLTPVIAFIIGYVSSGIQRQQSRIQQQQADTNRRRYRLALMDRRMKVFDSTLEFIALVLRDARIETLEPLSKLMRDTREHHPFFGADIELFSRVCVDIPHTGACKRFL